MITTLQKRRMNDPERNLAIGGAEPAIHLMLSEMEQASGDMQWYLRRNEQAYNWAHSRWDGQTLDGRKHGGNDGQAFPWEGASDSRLRTVATIIAEHVTVIKFAYLNAKIQATALRPAVEARQSKKASTLLRWVIYTQMRAELQRELPLAWWWRECYGAALLHVGWEQSRRLEYFPLSMEDLEQLVQMDAQQQGQAEPSPEALALLQAIADPAQEDAAATLIQSFSEILNKGDARSIVKNLRETGNADIPVPKIYKHKPKVTALRPGVEVIFPAEMDDPQSASTRWIAQYEPVTEVELKDRQFTDGYDEKFVGEALTKKGEFSNDSWLGRTTAERSGVYAGNYSSAPWSPNDSFRDLIELVHFYNYAIDYKTPCLYHTVFSRFVTSRDKAKPLYATHMPFEYDHGQMPYIGMRRQIRARSLLSSIGIAEEAYTDEQAIKAQVDGMTDRTSMILQPPMIVPTSRVQAIANTPMPRAVLGASRPNELKWMDLPPFENTPIEMMKFVVALLDRRYGLFGEEVPAELKQMRQQEVANDSMIEIELMFAMIFMLLQQYKLDAEVERIVGPLTGPFHVSREEIQGAHDILVTVNMKMLDDEYRDKTLTLLLQGMQLNQGGTANLNRLFEWWMNLIDPDLADLAVQDEQTATEKEKKDELSDVNAIMNGIEVPFPQFGNFQLRLQKLLEATFQSPNPEMGKRLAQNQDSAQMLQNRIKYYTNQIQQRTQNPGIGRSLATQTFRKTMAPEIASPSATG